MKRILILLCVLCAPSFLYSWGFYAHRKINRAAVFTLPSAMSVFYKNNIEYISEHSVDPDKRRYVDPEEGSRHFIDLDRYGNSPLDSIPKQWQNAVEKYSEEILKENGILPWQIYLSYRNLVEAFKNKDFHRILRLSADIGHYIADAHVPLHTTENYNGQLTNQHGIHAFWESRLPELFSKNYSFFVGKAEYFDKPLMRAWEIVENSFSLKDSVLLIEARLSQEFAADRKYSYETHNKALRRTYSLAYSTAYHEALNHMVEKQMQASILAIGSFWFTAWVDAGQPSLKRLSKKTILPDSNAFKIHTEKQISR